MLVMLVETPIVGRELLLEEISELILELLQSTLAVEGVVSRARWPGLDLAGLRLVDDLELGRFARFGCLLVEMKLVG